MLADGWKRGHDCDHRCPPGQCVPASYFVASWTRLIPWFTFSAGHGGRCAGELWRIAFAKINSHAFKSFNALLARRCPAIFFQLLGSQLETGNMVNLNLHVSLKMRLIFLTRTFHFSCHPPSLIKLRRKSRNEYFCKRDFQNGCE